jgi:mono/diheme cytochrome c family protein
MLKIFDTIIFMQNKPGHRITIFTLTILLIFSGCSRENRNHPGYRYLNDMAPSVPYDYYSENPNFADGATAQAPVPGTIPRGAIPYPYPRTDAGQKQAGAELKNPLIASKDDLETAKKIYDVTCIMCHGESGKGDGFLVSSGKFTTDVTSLVGEFVQNKPDGEIYHVITMGSLSGFMGSHSAQIKPDDRWKIVAYIKNKLQTN